MKSKLINIGRSKGVRIPKALLQKAGLRGEVEMTVRDGEIVVTPVGRKRKAREGWREAFRKARERGDDSLLDGYTPTKFDEEEWTW